jgi:uncharacterized protein (TIGR02594 family)
MRKSLRHWGAFCLAAGLATSSLALATSTAEARRLPHGYQAGASSEAGSLIRHREVRERPGRSAKRHAVRAHRVARSHCHYRGRQLARLERRQAASAQQAAQVTQGWDGTDNSHDQRYASGRRQAANRSGNGAAYASVSTGSGSNVVAEARRWLGTNPTRRRTLWCGAFMNFVLERTGHKGSGSDLARSFASAGHRVSGPQVGAIAVMARRGGGHVGVVSGVDAKGNPIIISGNHRRTVAESVYPRGRIYAYVMPN